MPPRREARTRLKGGPLRAGRGARLAVRKGRALTAAAVERLFEVGEVLSEGEVRPGDGVYFGSTMWTVDLARLAVGWRGELADDRSQDELLRAVEGSVRVRLRLLRLARVEVLRRLPRDAPGTMVAETRFRIHRGKLHADVDVEVPLAAAAQGRQREA